MWIKDPVTKKKSVSLTFTCIAFLGVLIAAGLQMANKIENTSVMTEVFYATTALYFGRRFTFKGKNVELNGKTLAEKDE